MKREIWKPIKGTGGRYEVSNQGRVKSYGTSVYTWKVPKILAPRPSKNHYLRVSVNKKDMYIHRLVAAAFIPNPDNLPMVNHLDANRKNNSASNLEWCTQKQNLAHAVKLGTMNQQTGEGNHASKLTNAIVKQIRAKYIPYVYTASMLSKEFKLNEGTVCSVIHRKRWKHLK